MLYYSAREPICKRGLSPSQSCGRRGIHRQEGFYRVLEAAQSVFPDIHKMSGNKSNGKKHGYFLEKQKPYTEQPVWRKV
jgi:hypothetical protein